VTAQLPTNLQANPRLSQWLRFSREGFVELSPGKVELGQGIVTALAQIAADETLQASGDSLEVVLRDHDGADDERAAAERVPFAGAALTAGDDVAQIVFGCRQLAIMSPLVRAAGEHADREQDEEDDELDDAVHRSALSSRRRPCRKP